MVMVLLPATVSETYSCFLLESEKVFVFASELFIINIVMLIFHVAMSFPHQHKSVSSRASDSTDTEAQQGGNQCLFVEGLQQLQVH